MYSDKPPGYVIPYDPAWIRLAKLKTFSELDNGAEGMTPWEYCYSFEKEVRRDTQSYMVLDKHHDDCHSCKNRNPEGVRFNNWCFRCPAGLMHTQLHIYDAVLPRDRTIHLY